MSEGVRQIVTRERTSSSRSKNDLKDIPIAGPLLGETQGQLTSPRNIKGELAHESLHKALEHVRNYLNHSATVIAHRQVGLQSQISQMDNQIATLENKVEKRLNSVQKISSELRCLDEANVTSKKLSKNLRDLANKLSQLNETLDESDRLDPLKFD